MTYSTPEHRRPALLEILEAIRGARKVVLTTHINADGDGTGCQVALVSWIRAMGGEAWIVNPSPYPQGLRFLLPEPDPVVEASSPQAAEVCGQADLVVVVDTGEISRIGRVKPLVEGLPGIVIDHHPPGDHPIPGISLRDPTAAAAGELVYDLLLAAGGPWPPEAWRGIYTALLTDTGGFRFSNTTPAALRVAAEAVEAGVKPEAIHEGVYGRVTRRSLLLLKEALGELHLGEGGQVAWMTVPPGAYQELGADPSDLEGFVDIPRSVEGVEVGLLFRALDDGSTKVSFRSSGDVDVNQVARQFDGGGHVKASGARVTLPLDEARVAVLEAVFDAVRGMGERTDSGAEGTPRRE
ncbi:MAG: bifunctional oligoribonuclease/PAP phosphatase NrnA [Gemmatimonadota bacterium]